LIVQSIVVLVAEDVDETEHGRPEDRQEEAEPKVAKD